MKYLLTRNIFSALLISICINLPIYVIAWHLHGIWPALRWGYLPLYVLFFFFIISMRSAGLRNIFLIFCAALDLIQMCHFAYYGAYIPPLRYELIFTEFDEIFLAATGTWSHMWYVPLLTLAPWFVLFYFLRKKPPYAVPFIWLGAIVMLIFISVRAYVRPIYDAYPHPHRFPLINSLHSVASYFVKFLPLQKSLGKEKYEPYIPSIEETSPNNIIVVMGESFSPGHMSLFGYERETTPFLDSLKSDPNFIYTKGYSASVTTRQTCMLFMNVVREPLFAKWLEGRKSNLFKLAKEKGYTTYYISAQKLSLLRDVGIEFVDHLVTIEDEPALFEQKSDQALLEIFKKMPKGEKVFVVFHQRCAHDPYHLYYQHLPDLARYATQHVSTVQFRINSYDNAILFNDLVFKEIVSYFKQYSDLPTYIFITSDHGESLGEGGKWGHSMLDVSIGTVPFLFYGIKANPDVMHRLRDMSAITHYEMGKEIARLMGIRINNPNEKDHTYTIMGPHLFGLDGHITIDKSQSPPVLTVHKPV